ncbi:MAG: hypothetical protein II816_01830 [Elusimicrobia bacterium]|nr:hypothetical protein [Elusimicrobiota bacterium]
MEALINLFFYCAIVATICFIIRGIIYAVSGFDIEITSDFTSIADHDFHFAFLSLESIFAFFMGFGWGGLVAIKQFGLTITVSLIVAFFIGLIFSLISIYLMYLIKKLDHTVKEDLSSVVGQIAQAYTNLEPNSKGQIRITLNSKLCIKNAFNETNDSIKAFDTIKITKYENNMLYVEKNK